MKKEDSVPVAPCLCESIDVQMPSMLDSSSNMIVCYGNINNSRYKEHREYKGITKERKENYE